MYVRTEKLRCKDHEGLRELSEQGLPNELFNWQAKVFNDLNVRKQLPLRGIGICFKSLPVHCLLAGPRGIATLELHALLS